MFKKNKSIIAVNGYYGWHNFGDDLFVAAVRAGKDEFWPNDTLLINAPRLRNFEDTKFSVPQFLSSLYTAETPIGQISRALVFLLGNLSAERILFAGGSLFSSDTSKIWRKILPFLINRNREICAIGVSIGPFRTPEDEAFFKNLLNKFSFIAVRDQASFDAAQKLGLTSEVLLAADLAGCFSALQPISRKTEKTALGLCLCNINNVPEDRREAVEKAQIAMIQGMVNAAKKTNFPVKVFNINAHKSHGDTQLSAQAMSEFKKQGIEAELICHAGDPIDIWEQMNSCKMMLTVRLHAGVCSYLTDTPFSLLEYHKKCSDFLDDIGQDSNLRINTQNCEPAQIEKIVIYALSDKEISPRISPRVFEENALKNFKHLQWSSKNQAQKIKK